ncbi:hypothetical protein ABZ070_26990 [Streptomyces sp. NPDC006283]|uniref:hypothetical protein n=1 Tax=Streptomyces sp. NPDC006283 TaxID=3156741 RepID=UPI0033A056A8
MTHAECRTEKINPRQFHEAAGVEDRRVLFRATQLVRAVRTYTVVDLRDVVDATCTPGSPPSKMTPVKSTTRSWLAPRAPAKAGEATK